MEVSSSALFSYVLDDLYGIGPSAERDFVTRSDVSDFWPGASPDSVARLRLARSILKKCKDLTRPDADERCLKKFLASNSRCWEWRLSLNTSLDEVLFGLLKEEIEAFFFPGGEHLVQSWMDIFVSAKCGPGASLGANGVDFYTKLFSSRLTATSPQIYSMYIEGSMWYPLWGDGELNRLIAYGLPEFLSHSLLTYVRKTRDISRSICTEPSLNMFFQLGFGEILRRRLKSAFGYDLSIQPDKNRELAKRGSIDGSVSTIDLESASDSVSLGLCEAVLPKWVFEILLMLRCPYTVLPDGTRIRLGMVSSMGNGFTFPLQTIIFGAVVRAVYRFKGLSLDRGDHGVFGDDIICHHTCTSLVVHLLGFLGFVVNGSKSYSVGPFRESCGVDYYEGVNVRGVYIKSLLTVQARYVAINSLLEWSARTGIPLPRTVGYLRDSVRVLAIPPWAPRDAGIRVPLSFIQGSGLYSSRKQRFLYRQYEVFTPVILLDDTGAGLRRGRTDKRVRQRRGNPSGLLFSAVGGYVQSLGGCNAVPLSLKQGESPRYRMRWRVSPFWGPDTGQLLSQGADFWRRWNSVTHETLSSES